MFAHLPGTACLTWAGPCKMPHRTVNGASQRAGCMAQTYNSSGLSPTCHKCSMPLVTPNPPTSGRLPQICPNHPTRQTVDCCLCNRKFLHLCLPFKCDETMTTTSTHPHILPDPPPHPRCSSQSHSLHLTPCHPQPGPHRPISRLALSVGCLLPTSV